jgi:hypothetical protein
MRSDNDMSSALKPSVGLLWGLSTPEVNFCLLVTRVELAHAEPYGECLTTTHGHQEVWDAWRRMSPRDLKALGIPILIKESAYDRWPRGRVVYEVRTQRFVIYADRRLHGRQTVRAIRSAFGLEHQRVVVRSDDHYRTLPLPHRI